MTALNEIESGVDTQPNPPPKFIETVGKSTFFNFFLIPKMCSQMSYFCSLFHIGFSILASLLW